jgi:hypothetical protein
VVHERSVTRGGAHQFPPPFPKRDDSPPESPGSTGYLSANAGASADAAADAVPAETELEAKARAEALAEHEEDWTEFVTDRDFDDLVHKLKQDTKHRADTNAAGASPSATAKVRFLILSGKTVSKVAVERRECKSRFKAALDFVLNRSEATHTAVSPREFCFVPDRAWNIVADTPRPRLLCLPQSGDLHHAVGRAVRRY